ncbi:MAG: GAF domain-containing protein [Chloroflexi bacterium]|nr:GAF domain-containing protein [Chloroflexota bacterium]MBP8058967.1 GAF domain-containing protein [Chloroflexota bacterium]
MSSLLKPAPTTDMDDSTRLQSLYVINNMLKQAESDGLDIHIVLPRILNVAVEQLRGHKGSVIVVNKEFHVEHTLSVGGGGATTRTARPFVEKALREGLAGWSIQHQQPAVVNNTQQDNRWLPAPEYGTEPWSVICAPLIYRSRTIGVITIMRPGINQFKSDDIDLLVAIAHQAAITLENARLFNEAQRQLKVKELLFEASRAINSSLNRNEVIQLLLAHMNELLKVEALSIALVDKTKNDLIFEVAEGEGSDKIIGVRIPANQGVMGTVMATGKPSIVRNTAVEERIHRGTDRRTNTQTRSLICAPLQVKGEVVGTIQAINPLEGEFEEDDLQLLINLANLASTAIANAQQFEMIRSAEERYVNLFEDSIDPIILTDMQGNIIEVNRRACDIFGYNRDEFLRLNLSALHPVNTGVLGIHKFNSIQNDKVTIFSSHTIAKNREYIPIEVHAKRLKSGSSDVLQWIHHDISKQVELEEMRKDLTAMLFHDLQSPLSNVISSLEMLSMEIDGVENPTQAFMLDIALQSSRGLQSLIHSLLDINRLEAGEPITSQTSVDIRKIIELAETTVAPTLEQRKVSVTHQFDSYLPDAFVDEDMIRRVFINLIDNAVKFSPHGQSILVVVNEPVVGDKLFISVSDRGKGIPQQYRKEVFEKFRRIKTKDAPKGFGLGLAFCRLAIEAHGGRIWIDDAPTGGARFNFTLPTAVR